VTRRARVAKAVRGLRRAASTGRVFHLWTHPFNVAADRRALLEDLDVILSEASRLRAAGGLRIETMGEVADMFRVNQSLLRFWEAEFSILQPKKNKKGDRYFRPVDIKNLHLIYHLLRQRKYTIEGAKDFLKKNSRAEAKFEAIKKLEEFKRFLLEMKANLRTGPDFPSSSL